MNYKRNYGDFICYNFESLSFSYNLWFLLIISFDDVMIYYFRAIL